MDLSQFDPSNLLSSALQLQWPAILLSVLICAVAWANKIKRIPEALRARTAWLSSPGALIAAPIYLWGCTAALDSFSFFNMLARSAMSPQNFFVTHLWATSFSQFLALFAVLFPGFVTALAGDSAIKSKDVAGALWAIAAVALDYLFALLFLTPWKTGV